MKWKYEPLSEVAPAERSDLEFAPDEEVWHLNLDQIESDTGRILGKKVAPASEAGNSTYVFDERNVLYSKLRPYLNKVVRPTEPGIATTELVPLRPKSEALDPDYLTYYLRSPAFLTFATERVAGAKMPRMIMSKFWQHRIPLPPPTEQRRIVELLDQADALRRMRREADALAERVLPALFYQMFGDPATNPMGWEETTLAQACEIVTGNTPSRKVKEYFGGEIPWARPADLDATLPLFETEEYLTESGAEVGRLVPENSILVCCIGATLGKVGLAGTEMAINQQINALLPSKRCTSEFLYTFCTLTAGVFRGAARKSTLPILNKTRFGEQRLVVPPIEKQEEFSRAFRHSLRIGPFRATSAKALNDLFTLMLQRAFSGELTSAWREAHMEELLQEMEAQAKYLEEA